MKRYVSSILSVDLGVIQILKNLAEILFGCNLREDSLRELSVLRILAYLYCHFNLPYFGLQRRIVILHEGS